jgi:hypothetical protein
MFQCAIQQDSLSFNRNQARQDQTITTEATSQSRHLWCTKVQCAKSRILTGYIILFAAATLITTTQTLICMCYIAHQFFNVKLAQQFDCLFSRMRGKVG